MNLDMELEPHNKQFFEVHMVQEEINNFNEAVQEWWGVLVNGFMQNMGFQGEKAGDGAMKFHE